MITTNAIRPTLNKINVSAYPNVCSHCKGVKKNYVLNVPKNHVPLVEKVTKNKPVHSSVSVGDKSTNCSNAMMKTSLWNARSLKNKTDLVHDYLSDHNLDLMLFTECWLNGNDLAARKLENNGTFRLMLNPRSNRTGGGVGCLYRSNLNIQKIDTKQTTSFEHLALDIDRKAIIVLIYRAEPSTRNNYSMSTFYEEFSDLIANFHTDKRELMITGDFNLHINKPHVRKVTKFNEILETFNLKQHVIGPTHLAGNTLDLIITREQSNIITKYDIDDLISDHHSILIDMKISKPSKAKKYVKYRKTKNMNLNNFKIDLRHFLSSRLDRTGLSLLSLDHLIETYEDSKKILDKHAPESGKFITIRNPTPWNTEDIKSLKTAKRKAEKKWRKTRSQSDLDNFREKRNELTKHTSEFKKKSLAKKIKDNKGNSKALFKIVNAELQRTQETPLPLVNDDKKLATNFLNFFDDKINKIRQKLDNSSTKPTIENSFKGSPLTTFKMLSQDEIKKIIEKMNPKHSSLDPLPTWLIKECRDEFIPIITQIVNKSLQLGTIPNTLKHAIIKPLLKKAGQDLELKNYRPVSNLKFLSKIIETAVITQYNEHLARNSLHDMKQSAYKPLHSTETLLTKISNDILINGNNGDLTMLVLLDLSAAFDTIDHDILLERLEYMHGIRGMALKWFTSYLKDRTQSVIINETESESKTLKFGVPQGSKLGPILFNTYIAPLSAVVNKHQIEDQKYADDEQLIMAFKPTHNDGLTAKAKMENCISDIRKFLTDNKLCNNGEKTEFIILGPKGKLRNLNIDSITVDNVDIKAADHVKNLGVMLDKHMTMDKQVSKMCQAAYFNIRNIGHIRSSLDKEVTKTLVNALVTPHLDYGNGLLYNISCKLIKKLQVAQNSAVRLIDKLSKREHITEARKNLHWLPIEARIEYKIITTTWKILNNQSPEYLKRLITLKNNNRSLRSSGKLLLEPPDTKSRNSWGSRPFAISSPTLWNRLPDDLKQKKTIESFKKSLKTHLFRKYYS